MTFNRIQTNGHTKANVTVSGGHTKADVTVSGRHMHARQSYYDTLSWQ